MEHYLCRSLAVKTGLFTVSVLLATPAALAQTESAAEEAETIQIDTIVVTGEKFSRDLKNTASSVSVKTAADIDREETGNASVTQVINDLPNVIYTDSVGAPIIRGQDTQGPNNGQNVFWGGTVPRATINLDGHYLNYNELYYDTVSVWDVDSIEVFRGPQTTSQGANAIAGAIIVNTKDPTFTPEMAYQAEAGSYDTRRASVMTSGPLMGNELAARLAVDYSGRDTFIDYNNPRFQGSGTDQDFRSLTARAKLLWLPSALPGFDMKFTFSHGDSNRPSQEAASHPFHKLDHWTTTMPSWNQITNTGVLDAGYDLGNGIKLFNQAQYSSSTVHRKAGAAGQGDADIDQKNISNESRFTVGTQDDVISGMGGLYLARTRSDESLVLRGLSLFDDTKRNLGLFGELNYRLTDRWTLTTGLRYQRDRIERKGNSSLAPRRLDYDKTFSALLPKLSLTYAVTSDWNVGALVSRGYNPGGVSLNLTTRKWAYFEDESVWNYELFTRTSLLDNRLILNGNLFYMNFKDAQYNIPVVISPGVAQAYTINAEKAHAYGLEMSADYQILDNLTLKSSAGLLKTRIDRITSNAGYKGNEFAKSPGYTLSLGLNWDVTDRLSVSTRMRHMDGYYSDTENKSDYSIKPYTIADARISYRFGKHAEVFGYVKNLFDDRSATYKQENRGIGGIESVMTMPRTLGIGIKGSF